VKTICKAVVVTAGLAVSSHLMHGETRTQEHVYMCVAAVAEAPPLSVADEWLAISGASGALDFLRDDPILVDYEG